MRKLFLIFSLFGLLGCAEEKPKIPAGLLPPAKLTSVLADIHVAEAQVENMHLSSDSSKVIFDSLQLAVYKKHRISEKQFTETYTYYLNNLTQLDKIYENLVDTLGMREMKMPADTAKTVGAAPAKPMPDSLKKALRKKIRSSIDTLE